MKMQVGEMLNIPYFKIILINKGRRLNDRAVIGDMRIPDQSVIHLYIDE